MAEYVADGVGSDAGDGLVEEAGFAGGHGVEPVGDDVGGQVLPPAVRPVSVLTTAVMLDLLDSSIGLRELQALLSIAVGVHAQVGLWACHLHQTSLAYRYLATACDLAAGADNDPLHARALGAFGYLFSSAPRGGQGGNPARALRLLNEACQRAERADGFTRGWLATWRADQHATLGDLAAAQTDVDAAEHALARGDGTDIAGFFSRAWYGYGMEGHMNSVRAVVLSLAGQGDEGDRCFAEVHRRAANTRRRIATYGHAGMALTKTTQPDSACRVLRESARLANQEHYTMGMARVLGVRSSFPTDWQQLACVRELDDELAGMVA